MVDFRITWTLRLMGLRAGTRPAPTRCLFIFRIHHSFKVLSNLSEKSGIGVFCLGVFPYGRVGNRSSLLQESPTFSLTKKARADIMGVSTYTQLFNCGYLSPR